MADQPKVTAALTGAREITLDAHDGGELWEPSEEQDNETAKLTEALYTLSQLGSTVWQKKYGAEDAGRMLLSALISFTGKVIADAYSPGTHGHVTELVQAALPHSVDVFSQDRTLQDAIQNSRPQEAA